MNLLNDFRQLSVFGHSNRQARRKARLRDVKYLPVVNGLETRTMLSSIPTATGLSASTATAAYGRPVEFTATVTENVASKTTPTGAVQFEVDGVSYGKPVPLSGGRASISDAALPIGAHTITAHYEPIIRSLAASASTSLKETISADATTTAVSSSASTSSFGQPVSFTAAVANASVSGGSTPTGSVQFKIDGAAYGKPMTLSKGTAEISDAALAAGSHTITATFVPATGTFSTSTAKTVKQVVDADVTTTSVAVSAASLLSSGTNGLSARVVKSPGHGVALRGVSVTLTATVANASAHGAGTPTGTVQFELNGSPLGAPVSLSGGRASLTVTPFSADNATLTALYTSNTGNFSGSSTALSSSQVAVGVAKALASQGATPSTIAIALKDVSGASDLTVATILDGLGEDAGQVAGALDAVFGDSGTAVGVILDDVGFAPGAIGDALVNVFDWAANQVAELFNDTLGLSESETDIDMEAAGFNWTFYPDGSATNTTTETSEDGTVTTSTTTYNSDFAPTGVTSGTTIVNANGSTTTTINEYDSTGAFTGSNVTTAVVNSDGTTTENTQFYDSSNNLTDFNITILGADGQTLSWASYNAAGQQTGGSDFNGGGNDGGDDGDDDGGDDGGDDNGGDDNGNAGGGGGGGGDRGGDNGGDPVEDVVIRGSGNGLSANSTSAGALQSSGLTLTLAGGATTRPIQVGVSTPGGPLVSTAVLKPKAL